MEIFTAAAELFSKCRCIQAVQHILQSAICTRCIHSRASSSRTVLYEGEQLKCFPHSTYMCTLCGSSQNRTAAHLNAVGARWLHFAGSQIQGRHDYFLGRTRSTCPRQLRLFHSVSCSALITKRSNATYTDDQRLNAGSDDNGGTERGDRFASEERKAGIKALLTDASTGGTSPSDDFDFDFDGTGAKHDARERGRSRRPQHDPAETSVLLFPGQGTQYAGMGKDLLKYPNVEEMFAVASEILGYDLLSLCINGPAAELERTIHCQPGVLVVSLAAVERLKEEQPKAIENCVAAAGFSVGEFAALVFAGSISFEDAVHVVKVRAEAMQHASETVSSGMLSVVGGRRARYRAMCKEAEVYCKNHSHIGRPVCRVANYLFPDGRVIAGHTEALSFIEEMSKTFDLRMVKRLRVSGAFHTPLMSGAQAPISRALEGISVESPVISVHSNVDGKSYGSPEHVRRQLQRQVVEPVLWEQTMHAIYQRPRGTAFPHTYEVGPGRQLGAALRRNNLVASKSYTHVGA